jgi:hypothetical protein
VVARELQITGVAHTPAWDPAFPIRVFERNQFVSTGHRLPGHTEVIATPILGGLHHEYRFARRAA